MAKGSGSFMINNKEEFYTAQQEILFDNTRQKLLLSFTPKVLNNSQRQLHHRSVYTDGYLMGTAVIRR